MSITSTPHIDHSFIADKYTQISRILNPIVLTIKQIDKLMENKTTMNYIMAAFGGPDKLKKDILFDFFRSAFDGSGADNFFDAGKSCCNYLYDIQFIFRLQYITGLHNFLSIYHRFSMIVTCLLKVLYKHFQSRFNPSLGSCIDGRLTSAWNWCSQLPQKPFYNIFKLTGNTGFDGEFQN